MKLSDDDNYAHPSPWLPKNKQSFIHRCVSSPPLCGETTAEVNIYTTHPAHPQPFTQAIASVKSFIENMSDRSTPELLFDGSVLQ